MLDSKLKSAFRGELGQIVKSVELDQDIVEHDIAESKKEIIERWSSLLNLARQARPPMFQKRNYHDLGKVTEFYFLMRAATPWPGAAQSRSWREICRKAASLISYLEESENG